MADEYFSRYRAGDHRCETRVKLNIPGERTFVGRGVSYCATCDGFFFRGKDITVVGGGDSALQEALFLTKFGKTVNIIHRRDDLRASIALQVRAKANPKISFTYSTIIEDIKGEANGGGPAIVQVDHPQGCEDWSGLREANRWRVHFRRI